MTKTMIGVATMIGVRVAAVMKLVVNAVSFADSSARDKIESAPNAARNTE
ncbi:hypothetical protein [Novipirellula galeiformis]|nr:hypothetical protein [Novipirellula galeiformis]